MAFRRELIKEHRAWLRSHLAKHPKCYDNWNRLYKQDKESALHEAIVRRNFVAEEYGIEPNETGKTKCPDFRCTTPKGKVFYVEAACIPADKVAQKTHLPNKRVRGARNYIPLTQRLAHVPRNKLSQCNAANGPILIAVGTFHIDAPLLFDQPKLELCLTGCQYIGMKFDPVKGRMVGEPHLTTSHEGATFIDELGQLDCLSVSGMLYFQSAWPDDPVSYGILHPAPNHKFNPAWLKCVSFGSIDLATLGIDWTKSNKNDPKRKYAKMRKVGWSEERIEEYKNVIASHKRALKRYLRKVRDQPKSLAA